MRIEGAAPGGQLGGNPRGSEHIDERAKILPFVARQARHQCSVCGYPLTNRPAWWRLCLQCFRGAQLERAIRIYRQS
jgi:hypothetical protein